TRRIVPAGGVAARAQSPRTAAGRRRSRVDAPRWRRRAERPRQAAARPHRGRGAARAPAAHAVGSRALTAGVALTASGAWILRGRGRTHRRGGGHALRNVISPPVAPIFTVSPPA